VRLNRIFMMSAVAILLVLAATILPTPALAAPTITLSPTSGTAGTQVTIRGINFTSYVNDQVSIYFGDTEVKGSPITVPGGGSFTLTFPVPDNAKPGTSVLVTVKDKGGTQIGGSAEFRVLTPSIQLEPGGGVVGTEVKVKGTGFRASQPATFFYIYSDPTHNLKVDVSGTTPPTATANGECNFTFKIPASTGKEHKVIAMDAAGNTAEATFSVIPSVVINPVSGAIGDLVTVTGNGFGYQTRVIIDFGPKEVAAAKTEPDGSFIAKFRAPDMDLQTYDVNIIDQESPPNTATARYTINAGRTSFVWPEWGTYTLMALGGVVLFFIGLWLGRKFAYTY